MSKMIQIRNVPDELHRALKLRAVQSGMSLSDYLQMELSKIATKLTFEELSERIASRRGTDLGTAEIVKLIREDRDAR
jgi:plasmid stability protein